MDSFTTDNWINILGLLATLAGGLYALVIYIGATNDKKTELIFNIYTKLYDDHDISKALYAIDKKQDLDEILLKSSTIRSSDQSSFTTVKLEKEVDKLLQYYNYLGLLVKKRNLRLKDLEAFEYHINQMFENNIITSYRRYLANEGLKLDEINWLKKDRKRYWWLLYKLFKA